MWKTARRVPRPRSYGDSTKAGSDRGQSLAPGSSPETEPPMKRFVLLIITITALAVGSVPGPAAASVPGRVLVSGSTDSTSDAKAAYVDCPGDTWLLGSGVDVSGSGRRFVIV